MKNILLLPRYTGQCNISVFKLFTPIRPKIKHQATCLDLSQKSSSSNTPTSDYYLKHYHQPKCNQPGHKFVDEDQEKTSEQSTKLKIFGPWRLPLLFLALVVEYFWTWQKKSESLDYDILKVAPPPTLLYSDVHKLLRILKNTVIQTVIRVLSGWVLLTNLLLSAVVPVPPTNQEEYKDGWQH